MVYRYKVDFYNCVVEHDCTATGICCGSNCSEAAAAIEGFYGSDTINEMHIIPFSPDSVLEIDSEVLDQLGKEIVW